MVCRRPCRVHRAPHGVTFAGAQVSASLAAQSFGSVRSSQVVYAATGAVIWSALVASNRFAPAMKPLIVSTVWAIIGVVAVGLPASEALLRRDEPPAMAKFPDVFLITVDTLRADAIADAEGLQQLATDGIDFEQAFAQAPWTQASIASLPTSRKPQSSSARWDTSSDAFLSGLRIRLCRTGTIRPIGVRPRAFATVE
jgi:hypothetical protein